MTNNPLQQAHTPAQAAARQARAAYRAGLKQPTAGVAPGMTQANMIALPRDWAWDFLLYAQRNPKPCPVLDVIEAGAHHTVLAEGADIRTDIPLYRVWRHGKLAEEVQDATALWAEHPDLVTFLIGCSFTFEPRCRRPASRCATLPTAATCPCTAPVANAARQGAAWRDGGVHAAHSRAPRGRCGQHLGALSRRAWRTRACGRPGRAGHCRSGQARLWRPGAIEPGEIPVFWACGVTPQAAVMASGVPFAVTHAPGYMFITDVPDSSYHV